MGNKVLVVDDDPDIRDLLVSVLTDDGYEAESARNGRDALDVLERWPADVVVLDLMMPVMDGWGFRAAQLADERLAKIPVVILSAATDLRQHAAQLRADDYLVKPLDVPQLLNAVERHI